MNTPGLSLAFSGAFRELSEQHAQGDVLSLLSSSFTLRSSVLQFLSVSISTSSARWYLLLSLSLNSDGQLWLFLVCLQDHI